MFPPKAKRNVFHIIKTLVKEVVFMRRTKENVVSVLFQNVNN